MKNEYFFNQTRKKSSPSIGGEMNLQKNQWLVP